MIPTSAVGVERKLQPFYLRKFVIEALGRHGGELREREPDRYEIKHVPATVRKQHSLTGGTRRTVLERYERITFDRTRIDLLPRADLVPPDGRAHRPRSAERRSRAEHRDRAGHRSRRGGRLETGLAERFRDLSWASVVEPSSGIGSLAPDLVAVGLEGTQLVRSVSVKGGELVDSGSVSLGGGDPPSRSFPVLVLSRAAGGLVLLGGDDTTDPTVYFHPIGGHWEKTRYALPEGEQAVAATFGFADHMLWLVVENGTTGKVVRADLTRGTSQRVADIALSDDSRPHLSVDRDGSILLARNGHDGTALVRFVPVGSKVQAERLATVAGSTIRGPLVDDSTYTFVQRSAAGTRTVRHESQLTVTSARLKCPTECGGILQ